jgi:phosphoglycolate phosphatase
MAYRLSMWDFDGTLADTLAGLLTVFNEVAQRHGYQTLADPLAFRDLSIRQILRASKIPLWRLPLLIRKVLAQQSGKMAEVRLFPDVYALLRTLHQSERRLAVLSSNSRDNILTCLRANGADGFFESVDGYPRLFGKARGIRRVLAARGVAPGEGLYVGDEVRDIEAARKAGVAVAAVTWGLNSRALLASHEPDHLIERPEQLYDVLA